mmetsp:Transcript_10005/g.13741  ORF Transcript_10005/g.13741 Transcript_10005/m.13741 type:complete len:706 (-) Transcript_10005:26-2143(-)
MGLMKKKKDKIKSVRAHTFITRKAAIKKLQLTLNEFRKLCILKGIYPRVPTDSKLTKSKTYYAVKDIIYLQHDPLIAKFRNYKATLKKLTRRKARNEQVEFEKLKQNTKNYTLDHIIKERYPTFNDALNDLDDALCLIYIYANLGAQMSKAPLRVVHNCAKLVMEWEDYIMRTKSLRKVFVSVKGIYYQASVCGTTVTWLAPHNLVLRIPGAVDTRILKNFLELYQALMGFVLFKLYADIGMSYPPTRLLPTPHLLELDNIKAEIEAEERQQSEQDNNMEEDDPSNQGQGLKHLLDTMEQTDKARRQSETSSQKKTQQRIQTLDTQKLLQMEKSNAAADDNENQADSAEKTQQAVAAFEAEVNKYVDAEKLTLFKDCKVYLSRETPTVSLNFVIRCFGGQASWEGPYAPFPESDDNITHQVADRNTQKHEYLGRCYVQPQWVYDSANERFLIPVHDYIPGATLPPHLSPFVNDQEEGYLPDRREQLNKWKQAMQSAFTSIVDVLASEALEYPDETNGKQQEEEDEEPLKKKSKPTKPAASNNNNKKKQVQEESEEEEEEFNLEEEEDENDNTFASLSSGTRYHDNDDDEQQQEEPEEDEDEEEENVPEPEEEEEEEDEVEAKYNAEMKAERTGKAYEDVAGKKRKKSTEPDQTYDDQFAMSQMTKKNRKRFQSLKRQERIKQEKVQTLVDKKNKLQSKKLKAKSK